MPQSSLVGAGLGASAASSLSSPLRGRVLVAEDYVPNQMVAQFFLERLGLEVDLAVDGEETLAALSLGKYDMVLLDVVMPRIDGLEVARRVRAGEVLGCPVDICLIATTTHSSAHDRDACLAAGMNDFLIKPFDLEELARYLEPWLGSKSGTSALPLSEGGAAIADSEEERIFDYPHLLAALRQNTALFTSYVKGFLEHSNKEMENIRSAIASEDFVNVRHIVHNWTGACGYLRAQPLLQKIEALAQAARVSDLHAMKAAWPLVEREMFLLHGALRQARDMIAGSRE